MEKKSIIICLVLIWIIAISMVSAEDFTNITVKTMKSFNLSIITNIWDPDTMASLHYYQEYSNYGDELNFVYNSSSRKITITGMAMGPGIIIKKKYYGNYSTGSPIILSLFDDSDYAAQTPENITINNSQNTTINNSANSNVNTPQTNATGNQTAHLNTNSNFFERFSLKNIKSDLKKNLKIIEWLMSIILILVIGLFAFKFYKKKGYHWLDINSRKGNKGIITLGRKDNATISYSKSDNSRKLEDELADAERKIKEAQASIESIRNKKQKVLDAERKFAEAKKELEELQD